MMTDIITNGVSYSLKELPGKIRNEDLKYMIESGNHKSATSSENEATILRHYKKEVECVWMLPVAFECATNIKGVGVIHIGASTKFKIDDKGNRKTKQRTTHDASSPPPSDKPINNQMIWELLTKCFYGHCLIRILHIINSMQYAYPRLRILICKLDPNAVYRSLYVLATMIVLTITLLKKIAYILLHLPFGVANGLNDFDLVSEPNIDLTHDILRDGLWDPTKTHSPLQPHFKPPHERYPKDTSFGKACKLFVTVPFNWSVDDGYIDDIITAALDYSNWVANGQNAAPLAAHILFRPTNKYNPLFEGEGMPNETKTILGWVLNTHRFRIYLPKMKAKD